MMLIAAALAIASYLNLATTTFLATPSPLRGITMAFNIPAWQVTPRSSRGGCLRLTRSTAPVIPRTRMRDHLRGLVVGGW